MEFNFAVGKRPGQQRGHNSQGRERHVRYQKVLRFAVDSVMRD
jgi:hypothetical protein